MKVNGARALALVLKKLGVMNIWGMPGAKILPIYNEIDDVGIKSILVTNELSASFMADGYFRVSGKPGVCLTIPGPGFTNMLTGIAEAFLDSSALLIITVNPKKSSHSFHIHEILHKEIVRPIVKRVVSISSVLQMHELFEAYHASYQDEPGPVVVEIESQVLDQEIEADRLVSEVEPMLADIGNDAVAKITEYISQARQVGIYAGRGCMGAGDDLLNLSKILSAPIATTISGRGVVPEDYALSTGYGFGRTGSPAAYGIFKACDLILAIGVKFSEMATGGWGLKFNKIIHIDAAKNNLDKNYSSALSVKADAKTILEKLNQALMNCPRPVNDRFLQDIKEYRAEHAAQIGKKQSNNSLHPAKFLQVLRKCLPRDAILSTDVGYHQLWSLSDFDVYAPGTYLTPTDYQAMGFGIPAALGAATAMPDKTVICVCGDGGFLISGFELLTAVREGLNLSVFVFNDGALGLIKGLQKKIYNRHVSVDLKNPDFQQLACSFGAKYFLISDDVNLEERLGAIIKHQGVNLVECKIVYDELPRYIKGSMRNTWENMPLSKKMAVLYRYVKCRLG